MASTLSVVMYHYVRPAEQIKTSKIPGLSLEKFVSQLDYLKKHYSILDPFSFASGQPVETEKPPLLLTFDDAYTDHYEYALPAMLEAGVSGMFFVPARVVVERKLLDVNKIHYLLAGQEDRKRIIDHIHQVISASTLDLLPVPEYLRLYHVGEAFKPGTRTFDDKDTTYIKRILQVGLPDDFRSQLVDQLFQKFVAVEEEELANETYCSVAQLEEMVAKGMMLGGHGYYHNWLGFLSEADQREELAKSRHFLNQFGDTDKLNCFAYPYGSFQESSFAILSEHGFKYAFTTMRGENREGYANLEIERLDTNDLPFY